MIFLDTNICIYAMRGEPQRVIDRFIACTDPLYVSTVVVAELEYGVANSTRVAANTRRLSDFLDQLQIVDWDRACAKAYGRVRMAVKRHPISAEDLMIAACALANDGVLVTNNASEFSRVPGLKIENWA